MLMKQIAQKLGVVEPEESDAPLLDTRVKPVVRIINGALDEDPDSPNSIVLNGRLAPETLRFLKVDSSYQRPLGDRSDIFEALKNGIVVPNIDVGVRGQDFTTEGDDYLIHSPAYIIDGWQRVGNALRILDLIPNHPIRMFATIHFGTDELWERHRFTELNKNVRKVSPNLHLRNMRDSNRAVATLYGLSNSAREFALYERVCWSQNMKRGELVPALTVVKVAMRLHSHIGGVATGNVERITAGLLKSADKAKLDTFRRNVTTFFGVIEECWGLQKIEFRHNAPQIKSQFMNQLARMFSLHIDFWDQSDRVFFVSANMRRKLSSFPLDDPHVKNLAGTGGAAGFILYDLLVNHVNSGKRTGRLQARSGKAT